MKCNYTSGCSKSEKFSASAQKPLHLSWDQLLWVTPDVYSGMQENLPLMMAVSPLCLEVAPLDDPPILANAAIGMPCPGCRAPCILPFMMSLAGALCWGAVKLATWQEDRAAP